jgi:hypothetical protein
MRTATVGTDPQGILHVIGGYVSNIGNDSGAARVTGISSEICDLSALETPSYSARSA